MVNCLSGYPMQTIYVHAILYLYSVDFSLSHTLSLHIHKWKISQVGTQYSIYVNSRTGYPGRQTNHTIIEQVKYLETILRQFYK